MKRQRDNSVSNAVAVKKKKDDDEDVEHHHRMIVKLFKIGDPYDLYETEEEQKKLIQYVLDTWSDIKKSLEKKLTSGSYGWRQYPYSTLKMWVICYFLAHPKLGDSNLLEGFLNCSDFPKHPCGFEEGHQFFETKQFDAAREVIQFCRRAYTITGQEVFKTFLTTTFLKDVLSVNICDMI